MGVVSEQSFQALESFLEELRGRLERIEARLQPEPTCLPFPAAAKRLGVGLTKFKEMVKRGEIRGSLVGRVPMVSLAEILRVSTPVSERPRQAAQSRKAAWVPLKKR